MNIQIEVIDRNQLEDQEDFLKNEPLVTYISDLLPKKSDHLFIDGVLFTVEERIFLPNNNRVKLIVEIT